MFKVIAFQGVGDTFYQRPFIRELLKQHKELAVCVSWPQLFWDMPELNFWYKSVNLRTQFENLQTRGKWKFAQIHKNDRSDLNFSYSNRDFTDGLNVIEAFEQYVTLTDPFDMSFPLQPEWVERADEIIAGRKVCIVREPTRRAEWDAESRNPDPDIFEDILREAKQFGYTLISVGHNSPGREDVVRRSKYIDEYFVKGELNIEIIAALMNRASIVVSPVGYALPMSLAVGANCLIVFGGHVKPQLLYDKRMDLSKHSIIAPEPFCNCLAMKHDCAKGIPRDTYITRFREFEKAARMGQRQRDWIFSSGSDGRSPIQSGILSKIPTVRKDRIGPEINELSYEASQYVQ